MAVLLLVNAGQVVLPEGSRIIQKVSGKNKRKKEMQEASKTYYILLI
jgi:hypothetical protein